jgi:LEA14-like dessication related protein
VRAASILLGAACALSACSLVPKYETPRLSVVSLDVERADMFEQQLKVRMHVQNPNERALPVKSLSYTLELGGQEFARGASHESFTVPAHGEADFDMSVTANMAPTLLRLLPRVGSLEKLDYRLVGKVTLSSGMLRSIPFDQSGSLKLR